MKKILSQIVLYMFVSTILACCNSSNRPKGKSIPSGTDTNIKQEEDLKKSTTGKTSDTSSSVSKSDETEQGSMQKEKSKTKKDSKKNNEENKSSEKKSKKKKSKKKAKPKIVPVRNETDISDKDDMENEDDKSSQKEMNDKEESINDEKKNNKVTPLENDFNAAVVEDSSKIFLRNGTSQTVKTVKVQNSYGGVTVLPSEFNKKIPNQYKMQKEANRNMVKNHFSQVLSIGTFPGQLLFEEREHREFQIYNVDAYKLGPVRDSSDIDNLANLAIRTALDSGKFIDINNINCIKSLAILTFYTWKMRYTTSIVTYNEAHLANLTQIKQLKLGSSEII